MKQIASLIQTKLPNYADYAFCAYNMPYNHQWEKTKYINCANSTYMNLKAKYSSLPLNRQMIIDLFKIGNYYDGFLCAMIWGNIGNQNIEYFKDVFNAPRYDTNNKRGVETKLKDIVSMLELWNIQKAYTSLLDTSNMGNKIAGIEESFFTKLLYFAGVSSNTLNPQPLILDKVMHTLYDNILMRIEAKKPHGAFNVYWDYCVKMEELRNLLYLPTAGHVEALLFCQGIREYIFH